MKEKKNKEEIVMYDSAEAAEYRTDIKGWVSRHGRFFGDGHDSEHLARWDGSTHRPCNLCGKAVEEKHYLACSGCREKRKRERYHAMPVGKWDGEVPLYSEFLDEYFNDTDEALDWMHCDNKTSAKTLDDLMLVICEPVYARQIDEDFFCDELPEDGEVPDDIADAIDAFNEVVKGYKLSWVPGKARFDCSEQKQKGARNERTRRGL